MYCSKCGKQIPDGQMLCLDCARGSSAPNDFAPMGDISQEPKQPIYTRRPIRFTPPEYAVEPPKPPEPPEPPKKSKKGLIIGIVSGVVAVAAAVAVALNFGAIKKLFGGGEDIADLGTPQEQVQAIQGRQLNDLSRLMSKGYGAYISAAGQASGMTGSFNSLQSVYSSLLPEDTRADATFHVKLNSDILAMLESQSGMDMDWLKALTMTTAVQNNGDAVQMLLGLGLGDSTQVSYDILLSGNNMYMGVPELSPEYLLMDASEMMQDLPGGITMPSMTDYLPDAGAFEKALPGYIDIILEHLEDAESETDTISCGGLEQEVTALTVKLTEEACIDLMTALLEHAKEDDFVRDFAEGFTAYQNALQEAQIEYYVQNYGGSREEIEDWFEPVPDYGATFRDSIDEAMDQLKDQKEDADKDNYITLTAYVDGMDITGQKFTLTTDGEEELEVYYMTVWEDDQFAFEAQAGEGKITGEGSREKDIVEGEYVLEVQGEEILTLTVSDYDTTVAEGCLKGSFTLAPSQAILDQMDLPSFLSMAALRLTVDSSQTESSGSIALLAAGTEMVTVDFSGSTSQAGKISLPTATRPFTSEADVQEWVMTWDFASLLDALEDAGLPAELADQLRAQLS